VRVALKVKVLMLDDVIFDWGLYLSLVAGALFLTLVVIALRVLQCRF